MKNSVNNANQFSHKDSKETHTMYTKSCNIEIMEGNKTDEIIKKLFESLLQNYQKNLEEPMRGSEFVPDSIDLLYYRFPKIGLKRGGSCIDSPEWLKNKKTTINPDNKNSFNFAEEVVSYDHNLYMASLDVESLFTNITLEETIMNCVNDLFSNNFYSGKLSRKDLH